MGVGLGHFVLAYKSTLEGIRKLQVFNATWDLCYFSFSYLMEIKHYCNSVWLPEILDFL